MKKIVTAVGILLFLITNMASGQESPVTYERGVYFGGTVGNTNLSDDRASWLVRPFFRQRFHQAMDGEFSFGIGMLNSTEYRTRVIPIDYTFNIYPFRSDFGYGSGVLRSADMFLYAGIGVLNYHHTKVLRPDDPFTVDAGSTIINTDYWTFDKNWIAQAPVGIGTKIWADASTAITVKGGYTFTNSQKLAASALDNKEGYWSVSVGLSVGRGRSVVEQPVVIPVIPQPIVEVDQPTPPPTPEPPVSVPVEVEEDVVAEVVLEAPAPLLPSMANFALLSTELEDTAVMELERILEYLSYYEDQGLVLSGHTDSTGADQLNDILGYQRAWNMKEWLVERGIDENRVAIVAQSYKQPLADNSTEGGRRANRRVEFEAIAAEELPGTAVWIQELVSAGAGAMPVDMMLGESSIELVYSVMQIYPEVRFANELEGIYGFLSTNEEVEVVVVGSSDGLPNEGVNALVAQSRAARVKEYLVSRGIAAGRVQTVDRADRAESRGMANRRVIVIRIK
jgi:outer membrane protein OmpA-like peptidoglycan-associated protein